MKLALIFFIFGAVALKVDVDKTKLRNCQVKQEQKEQYEELFIPDGEQDSEDKPKKEDWS